MKKFIVALITVIALSGTAFAVEKVVAPAAKPVQAQTSSVKKAVKAKKVKKAAVKKAKTAAPVEAPKPAEVAPVKK